MIPSVSIRPAIQSDIPSLNPLFEALDEQHRIALPQVFRKPSGERREQSWFDWAAPTPAGSPEAARRLFAMAQPIRRTLVQTYLRNRGITTLRDAGSLRFHPRCYYRRDEELPLEIWPAMIAAVTDLRGNITGAHRTWLDPKGFDARRLGKVPVDTPRRAMGNLLGHAVRFGVANDVLAAGEGIETMLSLRYALPTMPMAAALSANHLAALLLPLTLRRLYIARDNDAAGDMALAVLTDRAEAAGIEALALSPRLADFNEDLRAFGIDELRAALRVQLAPQDVVRFMLPAMAGPFERIGLPALQLKETGTHSGHSDVSHATVDSSSGMCRFSDCGGSCDTASCSHPNLARLFRDLPARSGD